MLCLRRSIICQQNFAETQFIFFVICKYFFEGTGLIPAIFINDPVSCYTVQPGTYLLNRFAIHYIAELVPHILQNIFGIFICINPSADEIKQSPAIITDCLNDILFWLISH